jgi:hypothetical protein
MKRVRKFVKNHQYEIALVSIGVFVGAAHTRRKYEGREDAFIDEINRQMRETFADHGGDFRNPGGGFKIPVWNKL